MLIYRTPIQIITKKTLLNITPALHSRIEATYVCTKNDRTFLMYDLDVQTMLDRLKKIPNATLLCSNPCIELWLLLHYADQKAELSSKVWVDKLTAIVPSYHKGKMDAVMKLLLVQNVTIATERAKKLETLNNPSTMIFKLTEILQKISMR